MGIASRETKESEIAERNREIGQMLMEARLRAHVSVSRCVRLLGTSSRRYMQVERGEAALSVSEVEALMRFFGRPVRLVAVSDEGEALPTLLVPVLPGQAVKFVPNSAGAASGASSTVSATGTMGAVGTLHTLHTVDGENTSDLARVS